MITMNLDCIFVLGMEIGMQRHPTRLVLVTVNSPEAFDKEGYFLLGLSNHHIILGYAIEVRRAPLYLSLTHTE